MKPHRPDIVSLTFALIFLAIVGCWLAAKLVDVSLPAAGWFVAGGLILVGVLGLVGALRPNRRGPEPTAGPLDSPADVEPEASRVPQPPASSGSDHDTERA